MIGFLVFPKNIEARLPGGMASQGEQTCQGRGATWANNEPYRGSTVLAKNYVRYLFADGTSDNVINFKLGHFLHRRTPSLGGEEERRRPWI